MDPPVLQAACSRRIVFMMTEKWYNPIWGRWFFRSMHCIPLREGTPYNIGPLKKSLRSLKEGNVIGIFPEGGVSRDGSPREGMPGTLLLAEKSDAPIVPAFISGTYRALPRHARFFRKAKIKVVFGSPVSFGALSKGLRGKESLREASENLMSTISMCYAVLPSMKKNKWGRIVAVTSVAARQPIDSLILSNTVRAGVLGFCKSLSAQVATEGITVNAVCPGYTRTERVDELATMFKESGRGTREEFYKGVEQTPQNKINEVLIQQLPPNGKVEARIEYARKRGDRISFLARQKGSTRRVTHLPEQ